MFKINDLTIRQKLTLVILSACVMSLLAAGVAFVFWSQHAARRSMAKNLMIETAIAAENCKAALAFDDANAARDVLSAFSVNPSIVHGCVCDSDGKDFAEYFRAGFDSSICIPEESDEEGYRFEEDFLLVSKNVVLDGEKIGTVNFTSDLSRLHASLIRDIKIILSVILAVAAVAYLLAGLLQKLVSGPILDLAETARAVSRKKDYSVRAKKHGNDEVGGLIEAFNEMLLTIQSRDMDLVKANDELEEKVGLRTAELSDANTLLKEEISERRRIELAILQSEELLKATLDSTEDGVVVIDNDAKISHYNGQFADMFDINEDSEALVDGRKTLQVIRDHAKVPQEIMSTFDRLVGSTEQLQGRIELKDGRILERFTRPLVQGGVVAGRVWFFRDITERQRSQETLRLEKEKADLMSKEAFAATQAKSEFLANMSHEIRTPMNAIMGFSDLLAEEDLSDDQNEYVELIRDSSSNLLALINDILDFSKIEAGKLETEIIDCSLDEILFSVERLLNPAAMKKGLEFAVIREPEIQSVLQTDPVRVRQCLINLVNNAIKFTQEGHVYIRASQTQINGERAIAFDVEDTGIGITNACQKTVFEAFTQADGSTTRKFGGTGLGLTITKKLIELLGGNISVKSTEGGGSVFSFVIPVGQAVTTENGSHNADKEKGDADTERISSNGRFSGKVLVAEDVAVNRMLIKLLLEKMGLEVSQAQDGIEAVKMATEEEYEIVFMDIQMPNMGGFEATRILRNKGIDTPIVAVTAHAMKGDQEQCLKAGCDDYISKPIDAKKLAEAVRQNIRVKSAGADR